MAHLALPLMIASTAVGAAGAISQGAAAKKSADLQASILERKAKARRAVASREIDEEMRNKRFLESRAIAAAAASGGGVDDPTVVKLLGDIGGEGEYRALSRLYAGEEEAQGLELAALSTRRAGKAKRRAGFFSAATTLLSGGSTFADRFG